jgi:hypothetical protein
MKVERAVDPEARIVTVKVDGELDDAGLLRLADELEGDPEVQADFSLLVDLRQAIGRKVTSAGVQTLASRALVLSRESRRAVIVPTNLGFGMARMYEMLSERRGGGARVFRSESDALRWLEFGV